MCPLAVPVHCILKLELHFEAIIVHIPGEYHLG